MTDKELWQKCVTDGLVPDCERERAMKKYVKEIIILLLQFWVYYISPLFAGPDDMMGVVFLFVMGTFVFAILMGCLSKEKVKHFYPLVVAILFIPTIFIYYNESTFFYVIWNFVIATVGLLIGMFLRWLLVNPVHKENSGTHKS